MPRSGTKCFGAQRPSAVVGTSPSLDSDKDLRHQCAPAPQPTSSARHHSHSPGQKWHGKPEKAGPPQQRPASLEPPAEIQSAAEHLGALLTPAPRAELLSPMPLDSLTHRVVEVQLLSTPDTFAAARDLIALTSPQPQTKALAPVRVAPSRGKLELIHPPAPSVEPRHRSHSRHRSCSQHHSQSWHRSPSRHQSYSWHCFDSQHRSRHLSVCRLPSRSRSRTRRRS
ncbi:hypothetical protein UY3_02756 [Chelonia mydas]|uniref:Uncharacterized protein n=1 Tax=Chelonia mydas TaxID=8469 RepID=M7BPZ6_CHEMY|nr:hypothetical protein UY3_02756 [Chelonia mydas]